MSIATTLDSFPLFRFEIVSFFIKAGITYAEITILLLILSRWWSKRYDDWMGYKKSLYFYPVVVMILEKSLSSLLYFFLSVLLDSVLGLIIITTVIKILIIFSLTILICKVSFKKNRLFFIKNKSIQKTFITAAFITAAVAVFLILEEWMDYKSTELLINSYDSFDLMTRATPNYQVVDEWILPYLSRICAVLFLTDRK